MSKRGRQSNEKKNLTLPSLQRVKKYRLLRCLTAQLNEDVIYWVMIFFLALCEANGGYRLMKWPWRQSHIDYCAMNRRSVQPKVERQLFDLSAVSFGFLRQEFSHRRCEKITFRCLDRVYCIVWHEGDKYNLQAGTASCECEVRSTWTLADMVDAAKQGFRGIPTTTTF